MNDNDKLALLGIIELYEYRLLMCDNIIGNAIISEVSSNEFKRLVSEKRNAYNNLKKWVNEYEKRLIGLDSFKIDLSKYGKYL